jgi:hypothetical protein
MDERRADAKRLGTALGNHHDLQVLGDTLSRALPSDEIVSEKLWPKIARRQEELSNEAIELGATVFEYDKGEFARKLAHLREL